MVSSSYHCVSLKAMGELGCSVRPYRLRRDNVSKQSGVPQIHWQSSSWAWSVNFPLLNDQGQVCGRTNRTFPLRWALGFGGPLGRGST